MESSTLKLIMLQGPREGETLDFKPGSSIRIGRLVRGNTVPIKDNGISSKHISIEFESGKWVIRDLDSSNGTLLNDSKLPPSTPFDIRHGDTVKIGEYTSIKVEIEGMVDDDVENGSRLRRNPRRRVAAAKKDLGAGSVEPGLGNRGRGVGSKTGKGLKEDDDEAELGLVGGKCDVQLQNAGSVAGIRGRRGGSNRTRQVKEDGNETDLCSVSEVRDEGLGNVHQVVENSGVQGALRRGRSLKEKESHNIEVVVEGKPRRGRPPKAKKINNGVANGLAFVQDLPDNVGFDDAEKAPQVLPNNEKISSSKTRGGLNEKSNLQDEAPVSDGTGVLEEKLDMNGLDSRDESLDAAAIGTSEEMANVAVNGLDSREETLEAAAIDTSEGKDNVEGVNLGSDTLNDLASRSGAKGSSVDVGDEVDLEKMTLGQWLDFLEVYLPKQIYEETEDMIAKMEEKAKRFHEFMAQQNNDKGGRVL